jgi:hypothetical protein
VLTVAKPNQNKQTKNPNKKTKNSSCEILKAFLQLLKDGESPYCIII